MAQLDWGSGIGLHFNSNEEYYEVLGFLTKYPALVDVYTHKNDISGAWAGQGKLETRIGKASLPDGLRRSFVLSGDNRLSISDYVENLINNHSFNRFYDPTGNHYTYYRFPSSMADVRITVPEVYKEDFDRGYNL